MTPRLSPVTLSPLLGFPEVREGDDIAGLLLTALQRNKIQLIDGDVLVVSSKVVSKALGLRAPAGEQEEVVLSQTVRVVAERMTPSGVTRIVESAAGPVMTAAGVDASNTADESIVLLLPGDPDGVAGQIRNGVQTGWLALSGFDIRTGLILSDTAGRPWRNGQTDFALGSSGLQVVDDLRGSADANGRLLSVTERCVADEIASAADLVKGKSAGIPAAHLRGLGQYVRDGKAPDTDARHGDPQPSDARQRVVQLAGVEQRGVRDGDIRHRSPGPGAKDLIRTGPQDWFGYGMFEAVRAALGVQPGTTLAFEVGIPFIVREDDATRAMRALRVALLTCPDADATVAGDTISLVAPDDFTLGVAAARTEVALRGEGLTAALTHVPARTVADPSGATPSAEPLTSQAHVLIVFQ
jgi:coenzyme F420-0:L-glutamate ligase/coenzyme F420-1:gamma-L-glutamate ligase